MSVPRTVKQLRELLVQRDRDPYAVLTEDELMTHNPESRYVLRAQVDGRIEVRVEERGRTFFCQLYEDESAAVSDLESRLQARN